MDKNPQFLSQKNPENRPTSFLKKIENLFHKKWASFAFPVVVVAIFLSYGIFKSFAFPYSPNSVLDPSCGPTDPNCYVQIYPLTTNLTNGQVLSNNGTSTFWIDTVISATGTVGRITRTGTATSATFDLATIGTSTSYTYPSDISVDQYGRIISATSGTVIASATGTAGNIINTGTATSVQFNLATTGVSANTYFNANITVDAFGRITSATSGTSTSGGVGTTYYEGAGLSLSVGNAFSLDLNHANTWNALQSFNQNNFRLNNGAGTFGVVINVPNLLAANYTLTLPADGGAPGQFLQTDGSGNTSWATALMTATGTASRIIRTGTATSATFDLATTTTGAAISYPTSITYDAFGRITSATSGLPSMSGILSASQQVAYASSTTGVMTGDGRFTFDDVADKLTLSGTLDLNSTGNIINLVDPVNPDDAANKQYVDKFVNGLSWKTGVVAATASSTFGAYTYSNGTLGVGATLASTSTSVATIDGITINVGDRILLKDETTVSNNANSGAVNGIYVLTQNLGVAMTGTTTLATSTILTRSTDDNTKALMKNATVFVASGTTNANSAFTQTNSNATIGTNAISWTTFLNSIYAAGPGLHATGTTFSLNLAHSNTWSAPQIFSGSNFRLQDSLSSGQIMLSASSTSSTYALMLPSVQGASSTFMQNDGNGNLTWVKSFTASSGLLLDPATNAFSLDINHANTWTAIQGFDSGKFKLNGSSSGYVAINAATTTTPYTLVLPNGSGILGQVLSTDGSGVTSWITPTISTATGTAGRIVSSGTATSVTFDLATTTAIVGDYTNANITVDQYGRITSATSGTSTTGSILTGYASATGTISATDTILTAIEKLNGNSIYTATSGISFDPLGHVFSLDLAHTNIWSATQKFDAGLQLKDSISSNYITFGVPNLSIGGAYTFNLPSSMGLSGQVLSTNGTVTSWITPTISTATGTAGNIINTGTATSAVFNLATVTTAATTTYPSSITYDAFGRITSSTPGSAPTTYTATSGLSTNILSATSTVFSLDIGHINEWSASQTFDTGLHIKDMSGSGFNVAINVPSLTQSYTLTLPTATGTAGQILQGDGLGNLSWITPTISTATGTAGNIINTGTATSAIFNLATTGTATGTFSNANITVDAFGRITSATSGTSTTGSILTGYTSATGTISATDTILTAIEKLNGNSIYTATSGISFDPLGHVFSLDLAHTNIWSATQKFDAGLQLKDSISSNYITFGVPNLSIGGAYTFNLPSSMGLSGQVLSTNGTVTSWITPTISTATGTAGNIINTGTATSAVFNLATTGVVTLGTSTNVTNANITIDAFGRIVSATSGSSTGAGGITAITPGIGLSTSADGTSSANITATGTLYSTLSIGIGSNQTIYGGANGGGTLTLSSTASTSKGKILFGTSGYDEANNFLGLGTASPVSLLSVVGAPTATSTYGLVSIGNGGFALGGSNFNGTATGTQIALNATSTFAGNLIDLQVGGVSKFKIDSSGNLTASSSMTAGGGNFAFTSGINPVFTVGDVAAAGNRVKFTVDDGTANQKITAQARTFTFQTNAASPKTFLYINTATSGSIQLGDVGGLHNYGYLDITGTTTSGNWAATIKDGLGNPYFEVQPYTGTYQLGSLASGRAGANNTALYINDATANDGTLAGKSSAIFANNSFSVRDATASSSVYFLADAANRLYELGDIGGASLGGVAGSGTALVINDTAKTILLTSNGVPVSTSTGLVEIGTGMFATSTTGGFSGSAVGTQFAINAASGFTGSLADVQVAGVSKFKLDYNGNLTLPSTGSLILTATGTNLVTIKGSTSTTQSYTLTLPTATGTTGQVLATDGTGNLSWATTASIPGSTWSMTASGIYTATNVAYGNGMFVAVDGLYNSIAISYNGTVWKQIGTFGSFTASPNVVAYGNGMFVTANAIGGGEYISTDGLNWTLRTSASTGLPAVGCYTLAYGNGVFFEAYNGAPNSYYSTDGLNWTATTPPVGVGRGPAAYGNGKWVFLPAGNVAETTTNFSTYATSTIVNSAYPLRTWVSLAYGNGLFVGVNWDGTATSSIVTSTDGVTWTAQNAPIQTLNNVTYGAGLFTAVSGVSGASNAIITSPDGVTWTIRTVTPYISQSLSTVAYGNGVFVALDGHNGGTATYYSGVPYTTTTQYNNTYVGGIFSMGNIGIGTTSPISALNIVNIPTATTTFGVVSVGDGGFAGGANNFAGSAAGTQIAVNATSTFTGSLIDLQRGGTSRFNVNGAGNIAVGSSTALDPFSIGTAVPSGATHALFNLANLALVGASATGTYIGANPTTFTGDFENYEVAGVSKFSISSTGVITATSDAIIDGVTVGTGKQTGVGNTVLGAGALNVSTSTSANDVAIGFGALAKDFSAGFNTAVGYQAMGTTATTGAQKSSVFGWKAGFALGSGGSSAGEANTFLGYESGFAMTTGSWNTIIGGYNGTNGLTMGYGSGVGGSTGNNLVMLGDGRYNTAASGTGIRFISDALGDVAIGGGVSGNGLNPTATPLAGGVSAGGGLTIVPYGYAQLGASDIPTIFRIDGNLATYTGVYLNPASAEQNDVLIDLNRTVTFDRTSINTLQRAMVIKAPNYEASVGGTFTLTGYAATMAISGAPAAGLRYLIGTSTAFYIGSNNVTASTTNSYGAIINAQTGGTNNYASAFMGGNVGIGTMAPTAPLEVYTAGATVAKFTGSGGVTSCIISSSVLTCSSDVRLKKNIDNINYGLADIMKLRPVDYNWKFEADGSTKSLGFIAQEVEAVIPNLVTTDPDTGYKQLNTIGMAPILTKAIQEMDLKLEPLTSLDPAQDGSLASLIKKYLQDALNGIQTLFANKVQTNELCLQDVCVTKNQLQQLLNQANINSSNNTNGQGQLPGTLPTIDTSTTTTTSTTTSTSTIVVDTATSTTTSSSSSTSTSTTDTTTGTTAVDSSVVPPVVAPVDPTVTP